MEVGGCGGVEGEREGKDGEREEVGWREMERGNNYIMYTCIYLL